MAEQSQYSPSKGLSSVYGAVGELDKGSKEYKDMGLKFDQKFGEGKFDLKYLEEIAKRLDTKFRLLADLAKEADSSTCDVLLFKNKLSREMADIQNEVKEAWNAVAILMNERKKLRDLFIAYQIRYEKMKTEMKKLSDLIAERNAVIDKLGVIVTEQKKEIADLNDELAKLQNQLREKMLEIAQLKKEMDELKKEIALLKNTIATLRETNAKLTDEIEKLRLLLAQKVKELDEALAELARTKAANLQLSQSLERKIKEYSLLKIEYDKLRIEYDKLIKELEPLRKENLALKEELARIGALYNELRTELMELREKNKLLVVENEKLTELVEDLKRKLRAAQDEIERLKRELDFSKENYEREIARLNDEIARLRKENQDWKDRANGFRDENEILRKQIEDLKRIIETLKAEKQRLLDTIARLESEAKTKVTQVIVETKPAPAEYAPKLEEIKEKSKKPAEIAIEKPKIKAFVEFEKQRTAHYTHYIAHPCPYCMPAHYGCPMHGGYHASTSKLTEQELEAAKTMVQSENMEEQAKGLRTLFFHAQSDPEAQSFIKDRYQGMDIETIIKGQDYVEFAMQLARLLSSYERGKSQYQVVSKSGIFSASSSSHTAETHEVRGTHKL